MAARAAAEAPTDALRRLIKTDPDPRVRQRAQAVVLVEQEHSLASVGRLLEMKPDRVRIWQRREAAQGRAGLLDRSRRGRPPALDAAACAFLEEALEQGPQAYGLPMTTGTWRERQGLLQRERGLRVRVCTRQRVVHARGDRYRRPRHDLRHRQDVQALAAARRVLDGLQKNHER
jgi:transposase